MEDARLTKIAEESKDPAAAREWILSRPVAVQEAILAHPPGHLYRMGSGHRVEIYSYSEKLDGTCDECMVLVLNRWNRVLAFERKVFGVKLSELVDLGPIGDFEEEE